MKLVMPKIFKKNSEDRKIKADTKLEPKFCLKKFIDRLVKHEKITDEKTTVYNKAAIIEIPPFNEKDTLLDQYWLIPPHAYATICKDKKNRIHYHITEPKLTDKEFVILEESFEYLRSTLIFDTVKKRSELGLERKTLIDAIDSFDKTLTTDRREILIYYLYRNFLGYGKLDPLLHDEKIEDITCNGADIPLFLYHRRFGNIETNCVFEAVELNKFVLKLAQKADKQLSLTTPLIDASLPDGSRAQITYTDIITSKGSSFTIRKFQSEPLTPANLVAGNTYSADLMAHIWLAVENRKSILVAGGTASGKTSSMNAISFFIPHDAKIVSIEDTREIQLPHVNWLPMRTRESTGNITDGNITMFSLLKAALRQRPEYIIVGEVRGKEAQTLFQAMNTGHTTYSTLHAGNVSEVVNRLTNDPINVPEVMFGALDLIVIQGLLYGEGNGFRRCLSLNEISVENGKVVWKPLFSWNHITDSFDRVYKQSDVFDSIAYQNGWTPNMIEEKLRSRKQVLEELVRTGKTTPADVEEAIIDHKLQELNNV